MHVFIISFLFAMCGRVQTSDMTFCSGTAVLKTFNSSTKAVLSLDGSDDAIDDVDIDTGMVACTCTISSQENLQMAFFQLYTEGLQRECNKRIEITIPGHKTGRKLQCSPERIDMINVPAMSEITVALFANATNVLALASERYELVFSHEPAKATLGVKCSLPHKIGGSISSTSSTPKTTSAHVQNTTEQVENANAKVVIPGSNDTMLLVGVLVGLGVVFVIFIMCLLLRINRRVKLSDITENPSMAPPPNAGLHTKLYYRVHRTASRVYSSIKNRRPLPRIPNSFRNLKNKNKCQSGLYDSIRSNNGIALKTVAGKVQISNQSSSDSNNYLHPTTALNMAKYTLDKQLSTCYISPVPSLLERLQSDVHVTEENLKQSMTVIKEQTSFEEKMDSMSDNNTSQNNLKDDVREHVKNAETDTTVTGHEVVDEVNDTEYMAMDRNRDDKYVNLNSVSKLRLQAADSSPYVAMDITVNGRTSTCGYIDYVSIDNEAEESKNVQSDVIDNKPITKPLNDKNTGYLQMNAVQRDNNTQYTTDEDIFPNLLQYSPKVDSINADPKLDGNAVHLNTPVAVKPKPKKFVRQSNFQL